MSIAVLTGGESLSRDWDESKFEKYDWVYAIDLVGLKFRHHYLCHTDEKIRELFVNDETKTYHASISTSVMDLDFELYGAHPNLLQREKINAPEFTRCHYTFPCALFEARHQSDSRNSQPVDIYGLDYGGEGIEFLSISWLKELPWIAYAMPRSIRTIYGDIREDWKQWILNPKERFPE